MSVNVNHDRMFIQIKDYMFREYKDQIKYISPVIDRQNYNIYVYVYLENQSQSTTNLFRRCYPEAGSEYNNMIFYIAGLCCGLMVI